MCLKYLLVVNGCLILVKMIFSYSDPSIIIRQSMCLNDDDGVV